MPDEDPFQNNLPHLGADQLEDEQDLAEVVEQAIAIFCKIDPALSDMTENIELVEQAIRELLGDSSGLLDHLRELHDARAMDVGGRIARWAFQAGHQAKTEDLS
jgi:hypothetical protein